MTRDKDKYFEFQENLTKAHLNERDQNFSKITELNSKINELEEKRKELNTKLNKTSIEFVLEASKIYSIEHDSFKNLKKLMDDNRELIFSQSNNFISSTNKFEQNDDALFRREDFP